MKIILILLVVKGSSSQDLEARFEAFLNQTLSGLGDWLKENNFLPIPIPDTHEFYFNGTKNNGFLQIFLTGEIKDRFYHGAEQNILAHNISSNLANLTFQMNFTYGSGNSYVSGDYSIFIKTPYNPPFDVSGKFTRSNQTRVPLFVQEELKLGVSPDGYFIPLEGRSESLIPKFAELQLEGINWEELELQIQPIINSWFEIQIGETTEMHYYYSWYIDEVFKSTPIVDIIGVPLPPTMTLAEVENFKKAKITKTEPYFDKETQQLQKQFISFSR